MKTILILVFLGNALVAISYIFTKSWSGAVSCGLGAVQTIINFFFESKNKAIPKWLVGIYALSFVAANLAVFGGLHTVVAIIATLFFVLSIVQKNGAKYRLWTVANVLGWILYDIATFAYGAMITHLVQLGITFVGIFINDRKK